MKKGFITSGPGFGLEKSYYRREKTIKITPSRTVKRNAKIRKLIQSNNTSIPKAKEAHIQVDKHLTE